MTVYTDQIGRRLTLNNLPERIISLVPSISYSLYELGLNDRVVGITRFCKFPEQWKKQKNIVGGTKDIKPEKIKALHPDLILASKEENTKKMVLDLEKIAPVYVSDVSDLKSNSDLIDMLGRMLDVKDKSNKLNFDIQNKINSFQDLIAEKQTIKTAYFIWKSPWMTIGGDTFIHQMLSLNNFENIYAKQSRYPQIDIEELKNANPELILLSSEPYPFKEKHQKKIQEEFPDSKVVLVQGEAFTWFGAYTLRAIDYFIKIQKQIDAY